VRCKATRVTNPTAAAAVVVVRIDILRCFAPVAMASTAAAGKRRMADSAEAWLNHQRQKYTGSGNPTASTELARIVAAAELEQLFVRKPSESIIDCFVRRDVLDLAATSINVLPAVETISTAVTGDAAAATEGSSGSTTSSSSSSAATAGSSSGSNALGVVLYMEGYGSLDGNESGRLWNIKSKKASRRRKKKRQTAWVNSKNYRLYSQGYSEMMRHRLIKIYINAFTSAALAPGGLAGSVFRSDCP
jgi:hypothetical protein